MPGVVPHVAVQQRQVQPRPRLVGICDLLCEVLAHRRGGKAHTIHPGHHVLSALDGQTVHRVTEEVAALRQLRGQPLRAQRIVVASHDAAGDPRVGQPAQLVPEDHGRVQAVVRRVVDVTRHRHQIHLPGDRLVDDLTKAGERGFPQVLACLGVELA